MPERKDPFGCDDGFEHGVPKEILRLESSEFGEPTVVVLETQYPASFFTIRVEYGENQVFVFNTGSGEEMKTLAIQMAYAFNDNMLAIEGEVGGINGKPQG
jgi:hypothetical protein